jgi:tRNA pseudouridine55 synthase
VDKPTGPTSHDVVAAVRARTGVRRVGHAGTLDPFASGLLPVLLGRATRLAPFLVGFPKRYVGTLTLGVATDTDDATGVVVRECPGADAVETASLRAAMAGLTGHVRQTPPTYSAKKVGGVPAHRRVRRGQSVALPPREITVYRFEATERDGSLVGFVAEVSSGTYVRALARDLGERLGCGAHVATLRRTGVGPWSEAEAVPLASVEATRVQPPQAAVPHLRTRSLGPDEAAAVLHGRAVPAGDDPEGLVALLAGPDLLAVAVREDEWLRPRVVLAG